MKLFFNIKIKEIEGFNLVRVHGELGATEVLLRHLDENGIQVFSSLEDIEEYIQSSQSRLEQLRAEREVKLKQEIQGKKSVLHLKKDEFAQHRIAREKLLKEELEKLSDELNVPLSDTRNPVEWVSSRIQRWRKSSRRDKLEKDFEGEVNRPLKKAFKKLTKFENDIKYQETHFDDLVDEQMRSDYERKARIDGALDELSTWLSGARGEQEALRVLQQLSDDYCVINNVQLELDPPLKSDEGVRFCCQIDHVVVGPTGVFCIEAKNWSPQTQQQGILRSPIKQARFNGKALWREITNNVHIGGIGFGKHRIGKKKIGVRNVVAMSKGTSEYSKNYVKVLPTHRLRDYVRGRDIRFSDGEVNKIIKWIIRASAESKRTRGSVLTQIADAIFTFALLWAINE